LSSQTRKKFLRYPKVLEKDFPGEVNIVNYLNPEQIDKLINDTESIAKTTYQRALNVGWKNNDETRSRILLDSQLNRLWGCILYIKQTPVAYQIGSIYRGILNSIYTGYLSEYGKYNPGTVIHLHTVYSLYKYYKDIKMIDFGQGDSQLKKSMSNHLEFETTYFIFAPTVKCFIINIIRTTFNGLSKLAIFIINKIGFEQKIKTMWRRRSLKNKYLPMSGQFS
jgi:hypothetical protein